MDEATKQQLIGVDPFATYVVGAKLSSKKMLLQIDRLDRRLTTVDNKMSQIQNATERYVRAKENISNVLIEIEKINEYFKVAKMVEPVIKTGLTTRQREAFFTAVTHLHTAQQFFISRKKDIKASVQALKTVDALIKKAVGCCVEELEKLLKSYGKTVELVEGQYRLIVPDASVSAMIRDIKDICETLDINDHIEHLEIFQRVRIAHVLSDLQAHETASLVAWEGLLQDAPYQKGTHPLKSYAALALETLRGELQLWRATLLFDSNNNNNINNNSSSSSSSGRAKRFKATASVYAAIADAIVLEMQRVLSPLLFDEDPEEVGTTSMIDPSSSSSSSAVGKKKRGVLQLKGVIKFKFLKRKPLIQNGVLDLINRQSNAFLIRLDMLDIFMKCYHEMKHLCLAALSVDAMELSSKQVRFHQTPNKSAVGVGSLEAESSAVEALTTMRDAIVEACVDSIAQLLVSTQGKKTTSSSQAVGVVATVGGGEDDQLTCDLQPITGNVLYCCKELIHFTYVYRQMYELAMEIDVTMPANAPSLTDLIATLLDNLFKTLQRKGQKLDPVGKTPLSSSTTHRQLNLKGHALFDAGEKDASEYLLWSKKHLFLANNLYSLHTYLQEKKKELESYAGSTSAAGGGGAASAVAGGGPGGGRSGVHHGIDSMRQILKLSEAVEKQLHDANDMFCETIAAASSITAHEMETFAVEYNAADKITKTKLLKAKFSLFNSAMDALLTQQGEWRVSSAGLREHLGNLLVAKICRFYTPFFDTYSSTNFSRKHMEEYLRFPPKDVERALRYFFGKS